MHEQEYIQEIVNKVTAATNKTRSIRIPRITVKIPEWSEVDPWRLERLFPQETRGTLCEGVRVRVIRGQPAIHCLNCGLSYCELKALASCPHCGSIHMELDERTQLTIDNLDEEQTGESDSTSIRHVSQPPSRQYSLDVPKRILVPLNFSPPSFWALDWAIHAAQRERQSIIYLLHVLPWESQIVPSVIPGPTVLHADSYEAEQQMDRCLKKIPEPIEAVVLYGVGSVSSEIARICREEPIDLVVLISRGHGILGRMFSGSISEEAIRMVPRPVIVLHPEPQEVGGQIHAEV